MKPIDAFIRKRSRELDISLSRLCKLAKISRQTLYGFSKLDSYPDLKTVVRLARALSVHPMILLQIIFDGLAVSENLDLPKDNSDRSVFLADINYPDGYPVLAGSTFTKTWEIQNVGDVPWVGRMLKCCDDDLMVLYKQGGSLQIAQNLVPKESFIPVPDTMPGETVQLSMEFTAPELPGTVLSYWKSFFPDNTPCFPNSTGLWVKVRVEKIFSTKHEYQVLSTSTL